MVFGVICCRVTKITLLSMDNVTALDDSTFKIIRNTWTLPLPLLSVGLKLSGQFA